MFKSIVTAILFALIALLAGHWLTAGTDNIIDADIPQVHRTAQDVPQRPELPTTLAGYRQAFANLPAREWGGGDIAVTTVLRDGRAVWFFGDTLTKRGGHTWINRNTALVQTGKHLHAANDGTQILPTKPGVVFWPVKVQEVKPGVLAVWTSKVVVGNDGPWDFKRVRTSETRTAEVWVDSNGDMQFIAWTGWTKTPTDESAVPADGSDIRIIGPGHWGYQTIVHKDLPLKGGKFLVTESQNWDNGHKRTVDYRPLLTSR